MSRPTKYDTEIKPHLDDIRKAVEAGATVEEIAKAFNIAPSSIYKYKKEKKEFSDAFARGREKVCIEIKAALLKKALGFEYEEEKRVGKKDKDGENIVLVEKYKRYSPPSETAAAMLLRNYDSEWLDRDNVSTNIKKQELELRTAIAECNNFDLNLKGNEG
ncbi:helix-turn-helix domain-containing protein [Solibacillus silvestris]